MSSNIVSKVMYETIPLLVQEITKLKQSNSALEKRVQQLERVSHEQPDMEEMIGRAVKMVKCVDSEITSPRRIRHSGGMPRC